MLAAMDSRCPSRGDGAVGPAVRHVTCVEVARSIIIQSASRAHLQTMGTFSCAILTYLMHTLWLHQGLAITCTLPSTMMAAYIFCTTKHHMVYAVCRDYTVNMYLHLVKALRQLIINAIMISVAWIYKLICIHTQEPPIHGQKILFFIA